MSTADLPKADRKPIAGADLPSSSGDPAQLDGRRFSWSGSLPGVSRRWMLLGRSRRNSLLIFGVIGLLYFLSGHLALYVTNDEDGIAMFWPASGIAAGAIAALGMRNRWPILSAIVIGTFVANLQGRWGFALIAVLAFCNALECLLFGSVLRALDRSRSQLESLGGVVAFFAAAGIGAAIPAIVAAIALEYLTVSSMPWSQTWFTWFKSDLLGIVVVAPLIITLPAFIKTPPRPRIVLEGVVALMVAVATSYMHLAAHSPVSLQIHPRRCCCFPPSSGWPPARHPFSRR